MSSLDFSLPGDYVAAFVIFLLCSQGLGRGYYYLLWLTERAILLLGEREWCSEKWRVQILTSAKVRMATRIERSFSGRSGWRGCKRLQAFYMKCWMWMTLNWKAFIFTTKALNWELFKRQWVYPWGHTARNGTLLLGSLSYSRSEAVPFPSGLTDGAGFVWYEERELSSIGQPSRRSSQAVVVTDVLWRCWSSKSICWKQNGRKEKGIPGRTRKARVLFVHRFLLSSNDGI